MEFQDKTLMCADCGKEFIFTAGEQLFFRDKQFHNDPKRCKACKLKRGGGSSVRAETRTQCSVCGQETTVPFRPTQGRPVLCRSCFEDSRRAGSSPPQTLSRPESSGPELSGSGLPQHVAPPVEAGASAEGK